MADSKHSRTLRTITLVVLVAGLIGIFASGLHHSLSLENLKLHLAELSQWVNANAVLAAAGFFVVYVLVTALSIPGAAVMTLAAGAIFGLLEGTLLVSFASTFGACGAFLVSRFLLRDSLTRRYAARMRDFDAGVKRDGAFFLFTLRLVPLVPFFLVNLLGGLSALRLSTFYWVSQVGMLPATIAYVFAGTELAKVDSLGDVLSPTLLLAFTLIGVLPLILRGLLRRIQSRRAYRGFQRPRRYDYNLIVIGAGAAGLVSAYIGAAVKSKVALIEKHRMGGDCLNTGCVPSKALIRSARLLAEARDSRRYGIDEVKVCFNFAEVMERVQGVIRKVEPHDSPERYRDLGVEVIEGEARLVSPWEVEVNGKRLSARSLIIASGARPLVPPIPGLDSVDYLTSDTVWNLRELPRRLLVLGGGPIGCELAQSMARFGAEVTIVEMAPRLLPREDADAAEALSTRLQAEGLHLATGHKALRVKSASEGAALICEQAGQEVRLPFDRILLALGRRPNTEGFGLEELGVRLSARGTIETDALLRTNFPNIHVCGDVAGPYQFTHTAAHQAWYAAVNALLAPFWSFKVDYRVIPWATFTDPEVARVGLSEDEAAAQDIAVEVTRYGIDDLDRAIADSADEGFVKVLTVPGSDRILGASIVGAHAGELIQEFVLAMRHGLGLNKLLGTIHIYPTMNEANKYAAGVWKRAHASQAALRWAERFFAWQRG